MQASVHHSFDIHLATELKSIELAILVHHFAFWIDVNRRAKRNEHDGKVWMYQTLEQITENFPYWSKQQVERYIRKLTNMGVLVKGNYNTNKYDRTVWYAFGDDWIQNENTISRNREIERSESGNDDLGIETPIPDTKTDAKTDKSVVEDPGRVPTDRKIRFIGPQGEVVIDESDFYMQIIIEGHELNYTTAEIQEAVEILKAYKGTVYDWKKFLKGTIENQRKAERQKFATGEPTRGKTKSQNRSKGSCKKSVTQEHSSYKSSTSDLGTKARASEPLVCLGDFLEISSNGQKIIKEF